MNSTQWTLHLLCAVLTRQRQTDKQMAKYVKNEDDSIDILIRIKRDSDPNRGCSECDLFKVCKSKQFKKAECFVCSIFGLKHEMSTHHIEITV